MLSFNSGPDAAQSIQATMRLRDDPPPITQQQRPSKKRKSPPTANDQPQPPQPQGQAEQQNQAQPQQQPQQPPAPQPQAIQVLPPPHALIHPLQGGLPPGYPYAPTDYTPGGMPPGVPMPPPPQQPQQPGQAQTQLSAQQNRTLSNSKRAEQNRKAQRAFRERRDQHVKALESRSQLLDAALASADEANRRWEECRALVDNLRVENAALRAALSQAHLLPPHLGAQQPHLTSNAPSQEDPKPADSSIDPHKNDAVEQKSD